MRRPVILFLYTELAKYTFAGTRRLVSDFQADVILVHYPAAAEAPFRLEPPPGHTLILRLGLSPAQLLHTIEEIGPDLIICSNWNDPGYLAVCKKWIARIPVVAFFDNPWKGTLRQHAGKVAFPLLKRRAFSHALVPGVRQYELARHLGFQDHRILTNGYVADLDLFNSYRETRGLKISQHPYPRNLLFLGRFAAYKQPAEITRAFASIPGQQRNGWTLTFVGNGDTSGFVHDPDIYIRPFVQPEEMAGLLSASGAYILASTDEHWGVAVQEMAAVGMPMLISTGVSAARSFLIHSYNGFAFDPRSGIRDAMLALFSGHEDIWTQMGHRSAILAQRITPEHWAAQLSGLITTGDAV